MNKNNENDKKNVDEPIFKINFGKEEKKDDKKDKNNNNINSINFIDDKEDVKEKKLLKEKPLFNIPISNIYYDNLNNKNDDKNDNKSNPIIFKVPVINNDESFENNDLNYKSNFGDYGDDDFYDEEDFELQQAIQNSINDMQNLEDKKENNNLHK